MIKPLVISLGVIGLFFSSILPVHGQSTRRGEGHPMSAEVASGLRLSPDSGLTREWFILDDPSLPVQISGTGFKGLSLRYDNASGTFFYRVDVGLQFNAAATAVEVEFLALDVWGDAVRRFALVKVADFAVGEEGMTGSWRFTSQAEAAKHFGTVAYVSKVRLSDGSILRADRQMIADKIAGLGFGSVAIPALSFD